MEKLRKTQEVLHIYPVSISIRPFQPSVDTKKAFDCGKADLNDFLSENGESTPNASLYEEEHLAKTYIVEDNESHAILAYFSLLFDKIERSIADPSIWNKLSRLIPNTKRRSSYPALKIGRLAVSKQSQHTGLGKEIIDLIKGWFFSDAKAGCRYLTVDANLDAEAFYSKCEFRPLVTPEPGDETVLMFFDLKGITRHGNSFRFVRPPRH